MVKISKRMTSVFLTLVLFITVLSGERPAVAASNTFDTARELTIGKQVTETFEQGDNDMTTVTFVMGATASGKTYFINNFFADKDVDIHNVYDYQQKAYDEAVCHTGQLCERND